MCRRVVKIGRLEEPPHRGGCKGVCDVPRFLTSNLTVSYCELNTAKSGILSWIDKVAHRMLDVSLNHAGRRPRAVFGRRRCGVGNTQAAMGFILALFSLACATVSAHPELASAEGRSRTPLDGLNWTPTAALLRLPVDEGEPWTPRQVHGAAFAVAPPTPRQGAAVIALDNATMRHLGLRDLRGVDGATLQLVAQQLSGGPAMPQGSVSLAHAYGGHQFGYWSGQLGDGRAVTLGRVLVRRRCQCQ